MTENKRKLMDKITKEFADQGNLIEGGWQTYLLLSMPPDVSEIQKREMRKAWFFGAQHLFGSIMSILEPGQDPTENDLRRMTLVSQELDRFIEEMKAQS